MGPIEIILLIALVVFSGFQLVSFARDMMDRYGVQEDRKPPPDAP